MLRWLTENEADTRAPDGPEARRLSVPWLQVWKTLEAEVAARDRWTLVEADPREGRVQVECRSRVFGFVDDLTVRVRLDDDGLTRVDARSAARRGVGDLGANRRRIRRLMRALERRLRL